MTALMNAIDKNNVSLVQQLLREGADINELDAGLNAPLVMAAYKGQDQILMLLLQAGANLSLRSQDGKTPLDFARAKNRQEIVALIEKKLEQ